MRFILNLVMQFAQWFSSPQAVVQVTIITVIWIALEAIFPHLDPNGLFMMYVMTIWSSWTQNLLAYAANVSADEARKSQDMLIQLLQNQAHQNEAMSEMILAIVSMQRQLDAKVEDIAGDIDDIKGDV